MTVRRSVATILFAAAIVLAGCAGGGSAPSDGLPPEASAPAAPKRIVVAVTGDPHTLSQALNPGSNVPGIEALENLLNAGLTITDHTSNLRPQLAEAVPSLENGLWELYPDGRMLTTWKIRRGAVWHDGTPFTAEDILFSARVRQDKELPNFRDPAYDSVESVEALDSQTVAVKWRRPFIEADRLFTSKPLPKHLLEQPYTHDKGTFLQLPYWMDGFVGTGPYKLRELVRGSHLLADANDRYALAHPKIDVIEVRFIPDQNTLIANVLAGQVEVVISRGLSIEQGIEVQRQWRDGDMQIWFKSWNALYPQFVNPNPAILADARFRRALTHAIDRQQVADTILAGLVPVAHSIVNPTNADFPDIEPSIVRYDHDPRRSARLLEELGYARGGDGVFRDGAGAKLWVQIRMSATRATRQQALFAIIDDWERAGLAAEADIVPPQRVGDQEYRTTFPGFEFTQQPNELSALKNWHSSRAALPENNFQQASNRARYMNPQFDALTERLFSTVPRGERMEVARQIIGHMTDQVLAIGMFYGADPMLIGKRLKNVTPAEITWNVHEWDVRN